MTTDPTPPVAAEPAPAVEVPAPATESVTTTAVETSEPTIAATPKRVTRTATTRTTSTVKTAAKAANTPVRAPVAAMRAAAVPAAAPAPAASPTKSAPIVDLTAKTSKPAPAPAEATPTSQNTDNVVMLGGGALALLALGGGAYALTRRKRHEDEAVYKDSYEPEAAAPVAEPMPRHDPVFREEPPMIAPSAFAWDRRDQAAAKTDDGSDRREGETWVERAYRGPSAANPSVSLRNRLKRAAFFDKRERDVAAGKAQPVEADAGLPEAAVDEQAIERERELA